MFTLPQLNEEDKQVFDAALNQFIARSEATAVLITDKAGFLLAQQGNADQFDATTLAALASGSFEATQAIARLISEPNFSSVYQQGESHSLLVTNIDEHCVLIVLFAAHQSVGAVKYYAAETIRTIAEQLKRAAARSPSEGIDLATLNLTDLSGIFKKKDP